MSIKIKITDKYTITSDASNFILNETGIYESGKDKGDAFIRPIKFYPSLSGLAQGFVKHETLHSQANSIKWLYADVRRAIAEIKAALEPGFNVEEK